MRKIEKNRKEKQETITLPENVTIDLGDREVILEKGDKVQVLPTKKVNENIESLEGFFNFIDFEGETYYTTSAAWGDDRRVQDHLFEDIANMDGECRLWAIAYDSGSILYILAEDYYSDDRVLQEAYEILMDSERYSYDEDGDDYLILDAIFEIPLGINFINTEYIIVDKEEFNTLKQESRHSLMFSEGIQADIEEILGEYIPEKLVSSNPIQFATNPGGSLAANIHRFDLVSSSLEITTSDRYEEGGIGGYLRDHSGEAILFRINTVGYSNRAIIKLITNYLKEYNNN